MAEMPWAIGFHPQQAACILRGLITPMRIPEDRIAIAKRQGWVVLGMDSDVYPDSWIEINVQSNPRRQADGDSGDDAA